MDICRAIENRRSIRKFKSLNVEREKIEKIINAGIKAPSGKNRQPWNFIILQKNKKKEFVNLMNYCISKIKTDGVNTGSCEGSINAIDESSATILIFNPYSKKEEDYNYYRHITDIQSIGACIENMILASEDLGLGTLWICDIFYITEAISSWLNISDELVAALAIGYSDQNPHPRPRKEIDEVTTWME